MLPPRASAQLVVLATMHPGDKLGHVVLRHLGSHAFGPRLPSFSGESYLMGSCQNCSSFLGTLYSRRRTILRTQKRIIILATTLMKMDAGYECTRERGVSAKLQAWSTPALGGRPRRWWPLTAG